MQSISTGFPEQVNSAVGTALEDIATFDCRYVDFLCAEVKNTHASIHWDQFTVAYRAHPDGEYVVMLTSTGTNGGVQIDASIELNTLNDGVAGIIMLDVRGVESVRFQAAAASASASSSVHASGRTSI